MDTFVRWGPPAPGADDGTRAQTAAVHRRVQGRGGQAARGERQAPAAGGGRARRPRQPAQDVAQRASGGRLRRGPGPAEGSVGRNGQFSPLSPDVLGGGSWRPRTVTKSLSQRDLRSRENVTG